MPSGALHFLSGALIAIILLYLGIVSNDIYLIVGAIVILAVTFYIVKLLR